MGIRVAGSDLALAIAIVQQGALAGLLLVDGNPLEELDLATDTTNIQLIMKDGKIYKNTLQALQYVQQ